MPILKRFKTRRRTPDRQTGQPPRGQKRVFALAALAFTPMALAGLELFAAFTSGGYFIGPMTLCVAAAWLILIAAAVSPANPGALASLIRRPPAAVTAGLALLFWAWTGASLLWSITGSETWREFNRTGGYVALLLTGLIIGRDPVQRKAAAWLTAAAATGAAAYGLAPRLTPSLVDNLDNLGRIAVPVGYTNGQGLLMALFIPLTLHFASARGENRLLRLASLIATALMLLCLFFTYSRGATYTLAGGLLFLLAVSPLRLRALVNLMIVLPAVAAVAWWSSGQPALKLDAMPLDARLEAAFSLRLLVLAALAVIGLLFAVNLAVEARVSLPARARKTAAPVMAGLMMPVVLAGALWFHSTEGSLTGWADRKFAAFTATRAEGEGSARLLSLSSAGRWQIWGEAVDNWREHKLTGSGGQSFPLTHLMKRQEGVPFVKQAHSLPLSLLSELGLVGFGAMALFVILSLAFAVRRLVSESSRRERGLAAALLTSTLIYLVHTSFDWDWNMMALTMPYFLFTGMLVGWRSRRHRGRPGGAGARRRG